LRGTTRRRRGKERTFELKNKFKKKRKDHQPKKVRTKLTKSNERKS
jgi:hypothetical protein